MKWSSVTSYFPTNGLNGSGQLIAVADTGIDNGINNSNMHDIC